MTTTLKAFLATIGTMLGLPIAFLAVMYVLFHYFLPVVFLVGVGIITMVVYSLWYDYFNKNS